MLSVINVGESRDGTLFFGAIITMKDMKFIKKMQKVRLWGMPCSYEQDTDLHGYKEIFIFDFFPPCLNILHALHVLHDESLVWQYARL